MISVKDVCRVLGISPTSIRKYEKYLPGDSWKKEESGYRGFFIEDLAYLYDCRVMIKYGISVEEAFGAAKGKDVSRKLGLLHNREAEITLEIDRLNLVREAIAEETFLLKKIPQLVSGYETVMVPDFYFFEYGWDPQLNGLVESWSEAFPFARYASRFSTNVLDSEREGVPNKLHSGFLCKPRWTSSIDVNHPAVSYVPAKRSLAMVVLFDKQAHPDDENAIDHALHNNPAMYRDFLKEVKTRFHKAGYPLPSHIYASLIYADKSNGRFDDRIPCAYYYVWGSVEAE